MPFSLQSVLQGPSTGRHIAISDWAITQGAKRPEDVRNYLDSLYRFAAIYDLNADILAAQSAHETDIWRSFWWETRLNPAGIGITGDEAQNNASRDFRTGEAAARAHVLHMALYTRGPVILPGFREEDDPRWQAAIAAGLAGAVKSIGQLTGTWGMDPDYGAKVVKWLERLQDERLVGDATAGPDPDPNVNASTTGTRDRPIVMAIGMGHRNTNRGGANGEIDWTPGAARALQRRAQNRNITAELIAENDGDDDPNFTQLGLQQAAERGVANIESKHGNVDVIIFMHHNGGGGDGAHFIHPDGWSAGLRKADNPGDVRLCRRIVSHLKGTNTVGFLSWQGWKDEPGVMSERESGAVSNRESFRLGEMFATDRWRANTFRVIAEAGSIDVSRDRAYITDPRWVEFTYCEAILDAIEEELGTFGNASQGRNPVNISPTPQEAGFSSPVHLPELDAFKGRPDQHMPAAVFTEAEGWFYFIGRDVTVTNLAGTPRQQVPVVTDRNRTGSDLPFGERFYAWWGGKTADGRPYAYTLWASRIWLDDTDLAVGIDLAVSEQ